MRESYLKVDIRKNVKIDPWKNVWYVRVILEINAIHFGDSRLHWTPAITSVLWETELWDLEITAWQITWGDFPRKLKIMTGLSKVLCDIFIHILSEVLGYLYLLPSGCILLMYCAHNWQSALHAKFAILIPGHNWDKHLLHQIGAGMMESLTDRANVTRINKRI